MTLLVSWMQRLPVPMQRTSWKAEFRLLHSFDITWRPFLHMESGKMWKVGIQEELLACLPACLLAQVMQLMCAAFSLQLAQTCSQMGVCLFVWLLGCWAHLFVSLLRLDSPCLLACLVGCLIACLVICWLARLLASSLACFAAWCFAAWLLVSLLYSRFLWFLFV